MLHISRIHCSYSKHSNTILAQWTCDLSGPKEAQPQLHGLMLHWYLIARMHARIQRSDKLISICQVTYSLFSLCLFWSMLLKHTSRVHLVQHIRFSPICTWTYTLCHSNNKLWNCAVCTLLPRLYFTLLIAWPKQKKSGDCWQRIPCPKWKLCYQMGYSQGSYWLLQGSINRKKLWTQYTMQGNSPAVAISADVTSLNLYSFTDRTSFS